MWGGSSLVFYWFVDFREGFYQMVGGEPEAPGVVVEGDGEEEADGEEGREQELLAGGAEGEEAGEVGEEDCKLGRHHVDHDGTDEEAGLALEEGAAVGAVVADAEGRGEDRGAAADGAAQPEGAAQRGEDGAGVPPQVSSGPALA